MSKLLESKDYTTSIQSFQLIILNLKKIMKNKSRKKYVTVESLLENKQMTYNDELNQWNQNIQNTRFIQILEAELTRNPKIYPSYCLNPLMASLQKWLSLTVTNCHGSLLNSWRIFSNYQELRLSSLIKLNTNQKMNYQNIYSQLSTSLIVDKWVKEDIKQPKSMIQTKKIKLYPTKKQKKLLNNWIGTSRYLYNNVLHHIKTNKTQINFQKLRNKFVTKSSASSYYANWMFDTPKEVRANVIRTMVTNYESNFTKNKDFEMHYKSKKRILRENITIPKLSTKIVDNRHISFYNCKYKFGKLKMKEKIDSIDHDFKIEKINPNVWYLILPVTKKVSKCEKSRICGNDLGMRKFITGVGTDGISYKIGESFYDKIKEINNKIDILKSKVKVKENNMNKYKNKKSEMMEKYEQKLKDSINEDKIRRYEKKIDNLKNKINDVKLKNNKKFNYSKTKNKLDLLLFKRSNLVDNLHYQSVNYLTSNYDIIFLGDFTAKSLKKQSKRYNRMAHSFGYYKFRMRLANKCQLLGKKLVIVNEYWTRNNK